MNMSSSNGVFDHHQRNAYRNAGTMLKRPIENPGGCGGRIGGFQDERMRYAPPQKRARYQTQTQFQSAKPGGRIPLYHHHNHGSSNVSRVSNYGDVINSNSSNNSPFVHSQSHGYGNPNPNPQLVPLPLPYCKLDGFDSLPEWVPNWSNFSVNSPNSVPNTNCDITGVRFNSNHLSQELSVFTNLPSSMPMNHSNMVSVVSQSLQQPIVSKDLADLLIVLNNKNEKEKENECPLGLDFGKINLNVRHESVIKSLYSDMPRQCSSCGVRFKCQEEHSKHMDWHVRKNRMGKDATKATTTTRLSQKPKKSRDWFASSSLWLNAATGATTEATFGETQKTKEEEKQQQHMVHADENQKMCALCLEPLEEFFSDEEDDWMYRDAAYLNMNGSRRIVHVKCMPEPRKEPAKESTKPMVISAVAVQSIANAVVC